MFAVWDAEEFGLIGSTEWAEKHAAEIDKKLVSYLNSDMNGKGRLEIQGSHTLESFFGEVLRDVKRPNSEQTLYEAALEAPKDKPKPAGFRIGPLGSGSDYTAFIHHLGVASATLGFSEDESRGIYHSIYDSFYWYSHFDDVEYLHGRALAEVMETALLRLSDAPLLPFEFGNFARTAEEYLNEIAKLKGASALRLDGPRRELARVKKTAGAFEGRYARAIGKASAASGDKLAAANELLYRTERTLLLPAGLPGRDWFKHQIYAPGLYTGYGSKTLPGIREAAEAGRWDEANREASALAGVFHALREQIEQAEKSLGRL
jgi:N-acetylated-alpha-linked acidic dipeptidase